MQKRIFIIIFIIICLGLMYGRFLGLHELFSFKFLLERENNTSILSNFNLEIIQNYFPEYKNEIQNWLNHEKD